MGRGRYLSATWRMTVLTLRQGYQDWHVCLHFDSIAQYRSPDYRTDSHFKMAAKSSNYYSKALMFAVFLSSFHLTTTMNLLPIEEQLIWISNTDGVALFRTPILTLLPNGDLLAFVEARKYSSGDAGAKFIAMKRSTNQGLVWGPSEYILDDFHAQDGVNTGAVLFDSDTNTLFLLYSYCGHLANCVPGPDSQAAGSYMIASEDFGYSWSKPVNVKDLIPGVTSLEPIAFGPGYGLQKQHQPNKGRLIACGHTSEYVVRTMLCLYSDDHGKTWAVNKRFYSIPFNNTKVAHDLVPGEVQVVELPNGTLFMTVRNTHGYRCNCRMQMVSYDGGETFPLRNAFFDENLIDPNCFASMMRHKDMLFFSNPASTSHRVNMTVRWSLDYGSSWPGSVIIHEGGNRPKPAGY
ncbi:Sialidase-1 [Holothuria leucospilota]|uniref:Sialidase-1 n=1 Tax=Holothuria leucospilota TaxID=206669 RepID=A0A9Q1BR89_HOLLE|nr:Sialidase-1 [Holothuria leucospilota]